jgi:DNA-binding LytR/AlgR family response regulator
VNATALIAEDEPLLADTLRAELARAWPALRIVASVADGDAAVSQALTLRPDVLFLDIRMPGQDGLQAAEAIAEDWPDDRPLPQIVFVTAYDRYAVQAFERQAVDYLLKPVTPERLARCCERLQRALAATRTVPTGADVALDALRALLGGGALAPVAVPPHLDLIPVGSGDTVRMVPVDDVVYFEAADKYVRVVTAEREHLIRVSLRELLPQLDARRFWPVHRAAVVQARCIEAAHRDEAGRITLRLRGRAERIGVSRLHAHRFKGL